MPSLALAGFMASFHVCVSSENHLRSAIEEVEPAKVKFLSRLGKSKSIYTNIQSHTGVSWYGGRKKCSQL
ncbi:hypothetical protein Scep_002108 [Stephania cephalantha]|uniref:Oligopeptidase A N-terminal domain-containing protein n=1 Tax=Stephania cephalantha TaxID=152367 RepID=A0AAP0L9C4_9MAGN